MDMKRISNLRKLVRKARLRGAFNTRQDPLQAKAEIAHQIKACTVDGQVQVGYWQMDCDCAPWEGGMIVPATVVHVNRAIEGLYDGAEGPVRWWITTPDDKIARNSRDHALEADMERTSVTDASQAALGAALSQCGLECVPVDDDSWEAYQGKIQLVKLDTFLSTPTPEPDLGIMIQFGDDTRTVQVWKRQDPQFPLETIYLIAINDDKGEAEFHLAREKVGVRT